MSPSLDQYWQAQGYTSLAVRLLAVRCFGIAHAPSFLRPWSLLAPAARGGCLYLMLSNCLDTAMCILLSGRPHYAFLGSSTLDASQDLGLSSEDVKRPL